RRRHTRSDRDWSSDVCSSDLTYQVSPRNKLNLFWDEQRGCNGAAWPGVTGSGACRENPDGWIEAGSGSSATMAPETAIYSHGPRSEEHTSELQSRSDLVCRLL